MRLALWVGTLLSSCVEGGLHETLLEQQRWLAAETAQILADCRLNATLGGRAVTVYSPNGCDNGECHYQGQWLRDFSYGVEHASELLPATLGQPARAAAEDAARVLLDHPRHTDGVVAVDFTLSGPANSTPGWHFEYGPCPFDWEDPCRTWYKADNTWSKMLDGGPFSVRLAAAFDAFGVSAASDRSSSSSSSSLLEEYAAVLVQAMRSVPLDPRTGLVWNDPDHRNVTYGFTDTVIKEGAVLYTSVLYYEAATTLAASLRAAGNFSTAAAFETQAAAIKSSITDVFWSANDSALFASTGAGGSGHVDVWGTAYAVAAGLVDDERAGRICEDFLRDRAHHLYHNGHVRNLPSPDLWPLLWRKDVPANTYQNGGYWTVPLPHVVAALGRCDPELACRLTSEAVSEFQAHGINEFIGGGGGWAAAPRYVASAANTYAATKLVLQYNCTS
jgi:hypothetical protein